MLEINGYCLDKDKKRVIVKQVVDDEIEAIDYIKSLFGKYLNVYVSIDKSKLVK